MKDKGHAAVELVLAAALLMLPAIVVVAAFGPWSERRVVAESAAAEAARAAVIDLDLASGHAAISAVAGNYSLGASSVRVGWCGAEPTPGGAGACSMARGSTVGVVVEIWAPIVSTPWGAVGGIWVRGEHSEPIDLYRSLR